MNSNDVYELPPRTSQQTSSVGRDNERIFRTALPSREYLRLEIESMERGLKPFGLTKAVMTLYLNKHLINVRELPGDLQAAIKEHLKQVKKPPQNNDIS